MTTAADSRPEERPASPGVVSEPTTGRRIAFIGLGIMGLPMAINLVRAGHTVTGYNRTASKAEPLAQAGGAVASSVAEAVADAELIFTIVSDSPDVKAVVSGEGGVFANAPAGAVWVDHSTIRPDVAVQLASEAHAAGLRAVDAPVSGGEQGAIDGVLSVMAGGSVEDVTEVRPVLEAVAKTIVHVGPAGSGQTVKAANQLIVASNLQALAEAVVFLEAHGVDTAAALQVLGGGLAGSKVLELKGQKILDRSFDPGFKMALHHKDMGILSDASRAAGVVLPVGSLAAAAIASAVAKGDGELDHSALYRGVQQLNGKDPSEGLPLLT